MLRVSPMLSFLLIALAFTDFSCIFFIEDLIGFFSL